MSKICAQNERIKREYFVYLKEAKRASEQTVDAAAKAIARFEADTRHRDFKRFHIQQATAFKARLLEQKSERSGKPLAKATVHQTLAALRAFFVWLAGQPGYRAKIAYADADYFNISEKDMRVATAHRERPAPTLDQVSHVLRTMPAVTEIERRDRAVVAFALLTGARDDAIASALLKHVDLAGGCFRQDAREVRTKFSKTFDTWFFPVGDEVRTIVEEWTTYLRRECLWSDDDPLFPASKVAIDPATRRFAVVGLDRKGWSNAGPIRTIFRQAFEGAGLPYFNPHALRKTLARLGERMCAGPEEFKAWSQNLGHDHVMTTFASYGQVASHRQAEILRNLGKPRPTSRDALHEIAAFALQLAGSTPSSRPTEGGGF